MDNYTFIPKEIVLHWFSRLYSYYVSKKDKRVTYKRFNADLHLDKCKEEDISYHLPESYLISANEINRLYDIRDSVLIQMHDEDYARKQVSIDNKIVELTKEHSDLKISRDLEKKALDRLRARIRSTKNSEDVIAMESRIDTAKAKLKNTDAAIANCKNQIIKLGNIRKENHLNWEKQKKLVEKTIEIMIGKYIKRATKKIELTYGFTNYTHAVKKYDEDCKKMIRGEYYNEKASPIY